VGKIPFLLLAILPALFIGCVGQKEGAAPALPAEGTIPASSFSFPQVPVQYAAHYVVNENGAETVKSVWASGNRMRIELSDGGSGYFSLYFLGNRAYSCAAPGQNASCFEVSSRVSIKPDEVLPCQYLEGSEQAEEVDIGGTAGRCYLKPYGVFGKRKICCTERGVLAYDEYNQTGGKTHVEYLTDISYSAKDEDFLLPATPKNAPEE